MWNWRPRGVCEKQARPVAVPVAAEVVPAVCMQQVLCFFFLSVASMVRGVYLWLLFVSAGGGRPSSSLVSVLNAAAAAGVSVFIDQSNHAHYHQHHVPRLVFEILFVFLVYVVVLCVRVAVGASCKHRVCIVFGSGEGQSSSSSWWESTSNWEPG